MAAAVSRITAATTPSAEPTATDMRANPARPGSTSDMYSRRVVAACALTAAPSATSTPHATSTTFSVLFG